MLFFPKRKYKKLLSYPPPVEFRFIKGQDYESGIAAMEANIDGEWKPMPGFWPLIDEHYSPTPFMVVGTNGGWPKSGDFFLKRYWNTYLFIYSAMYGPDLKKNFQKASKKFDALMILDYKKQVKGKSLFCSHAMMTTSLPLKNGFFWQPVKQKKQYDFSILTWGPNDKECKRWDRARKIAIYLCHHGLKGIIITQRGKKEDLLDRETLALVNNHQLLIDEAHYARVEFHELMSQAKVGIFPNTVDAFPRFMIETLLADKPVILADDLMLGKTIMETLPNDIRYIVDFDDKKSFSSILKFINNYNKNTSPRNEWLNRYSFDKLSRKWAEECNLVFDTTYKQLFYLNHLPRLKLLQSKYD